MAQTFKERHEHAMSAMAKSIDSRRTEAERIRRYQLQNADGYPWEPGIYTKTWSYHSLKRCNEMYAAFLKRMQLPGREGFQLITQNITSNGNTISMIITYKL